MPPRRPHVLGIDDGPFAKDQPHPVPLVAVTMQGADVVEHVAVCAFPVDGAGVTAFLAGWIEELRTRASLQAVVIGGITIAGLGIVDAAGLSARTGLPVLTVTRRQPSDGPLLDALRAAGLEDRAPIVRATPRAVRVDEGLYVSPAGMPEDEAIARPAVRGKARLPEPLRVAHLIARAVAGGESSGRA